MQKIESKCCQQKIYKSSQKRKRKKNPYVVINVTKVGSDGTELC